MVQIEFQTTSVNQSVLRLQEDIPLNHWLVLQSRLKTPYETKYTVIYQVQQT